MEKEKVKHLNRKIAISVAIISTFLAVSKVKDDNVVQAMVQAKTDALDSWNEYQSKKIKDHLAKNSLPLYQALGQLLSDKGTGSKLALQKLNTAQELLEKDLDRYSKEENEIMAKAKVYERTYEELNRKDDEFDLSDACLSISLMVLAVVALTAQDWLLWMAWSFSSFGLLFGLSGFLGWNFRPEWLVRLLT